MIVTKNASLVVFAASKYSRKALSVGAKMVNEPPDRASVSPATSIASARVCVERVFECMRECFEREIVCEKQHNAMAIMFLC